MLVEKVSPMNSSEDNDVKDATAALKGMLGISGSSSTKAEEIFTPNKTPGKTNQQQKKGKGKPPKSSKNPKEQKNAGDSRSSSTKKGSNKKEKKENFAWSAFQASPDASALPIPAFQSPSNSLRATKEVSTELDADKLSTLLMGVAVSIPSTPVPPPVELANAPRAEDLEAEAIAAAEIAERVAAVEIPEIPPQLETPAKPTEPEKPESASGINLAALAASPSSRVAPSPQQAPPTASLPPTPFSSPNHFPSPYRSPHLGQFMPPSPGYITINVQVPPLLGPDRRMVVASPAGYPVQILVPGGVPPGMVIPVHIPAGPLMPQSPYSAAYQQQYQHHPQHYQQHQPPK